MKQPDFLKEDVSQQSASALLMGLIYFRPHNQLCRVLLTLLLIFLSYVATFSQPPGTNGLTIYVDSGRITISRHIYGQFSEHLGRCIYEGIWVGENSPIPNTHGIRKDVVAALKNIKIPNLRWPGGCFADEYHWRNGIGPRESRPKMVNTTWGGVIDDNSFGTHEFMDLCDQLSCEPVICGNIGSGTVKEMSDWIEYLNSDKVTPMAELRKANGRDKPWNVKYWCVGNETWGCGGFMSADYYANEFARYSYFLRNTGNVSLSRIASGGREDDYAWTEKIMEKWSKADGWLRGILGGYSLHYYTVCNNWEKKGSATEFSEDEWFSTIFKTLKMDKLISEHSAVMDKYDTEKKVGLVVDEWGDWHDVEPGTNPGFLYQQNTLRDAMVAALNLNIFHKHCDRVRMANISQAVNVLQALILTDREKMILTPTYYVFDLYKVHQDAVYLPVELVSEDYELNSRNVPALSATASIDSEGLIHISIVNVNPAKSIPLACTIKGIKPKVLSAKILTSPRMQDHNTFEEPWKVSLQDFRQIRITGSELRIEIPSKSIIMVELKK
jgi:alpha-N-arabinofuranosidase